MDSRPIASERYHPNSVVRLRGKAGLSIRDLAAAAGINEKTLRWIEVGRIPLRTTFAVKLSSALGCAPEDLAGPARSPRNAHIVTRRRLKNLKLGRGAARWAGKLPVPDTAHPLVRDLFTEMNNQMMLIEDVAQISGVSKRAISDWRYRRSPNVETLQAVLNTLGLELRVSTRGEDYDSGRDDS